jgi:hypothetical protein
MAELRAETIDLSKVVRASKSQNAKLIRSIAIRVKMEILKEARNSLGTTLNDYIRGLQIDHISETSARIVLTGPIANMIEQGLGSGGIGTTGPRDMRAVLLKPGTRSLRHGKNGMYLHVPFTHTKGSIESKGGASAMTAARRLSPTQTSQRGASRVTRWAPGETGRLGNEFHKHLTGMVRLEKQYAGATQSTYRTWRTISEASKTGWIAAPIKARNFFEKINMLVPQFVNEARARMNQ